MIRAGAKVERAIVDAGAQVPAGEQVRSTDRDEPITIYTASDD